MQNNQTDLTVAANNPNIQAITNNMAIISELPAILQTHCLRVSKAIDTGERILSDIEKAGGLSPSLDELAKSFIVRCAEVKKELENNRKPGTQSFDIIRSFFTAEETKISVDNKESVVYKLKVLRDQFAAAESQRQKEEQLKMEQKINKGKEEVSFRSNIEFQLSNAAIKIISGKKEQMNKAFNLIQLEEFETREKQLRNMVVQFPTDTFLVTKLNKPAVIYLTDIETDQLITDEIKKFNVLSFQDEYNKQIQDLKTELISKLPAKKQELEKIKAAGEEEKIRLQQEQQKRQQEEEEKLKAEEARQKEAALNQSKANEMAGHTQTLFDVTAEATISTASETKKKTEIEILNHGGIADLFAFWLLNEGKTLSVEDCLSVKISSMKTFAESQYKKNSNNKIISQNLSYVEKVIAVNRKTK